MTTSPDHRTEPRLGIEATIFIEVLASDAEKAGNVILCNSLDVSSNGMQVVVNDGIGEGSICRVCLDLRGNAPIYLYGEVIWTQPGDDDDTTRVGFRMLDADSSDIARWKEVVISRGDPTPASQ